MLDNYSEIQARLMEHDTPEEAEEAPQRRGLLSRLRGQPAPAEAPTEAEMPVARPSFDREYAQLHQELLSYKEVLGKAMAMLNGDVQQKDFDYYVDRKARRTTAGYKMDPTQKELWATRASMLNRMQNQMKAVETFEERVNLLAYQRKVSNTD